MSSSSRHPRRPRIFGIGLNKTATTSFHEAMTILGYESLHWGGPEIAAKVRSAIDADRPLLSNLDQRFDAFSDIGLLSRRFQRLDHQYPGSKFVYTFRPIDVWVDSRRRHVERNLERKARGEYDGNFLVIDEPKWRAEYAEHNERVMAYFADRDDDFVRVDITDGEGWAPFCRLLGRADPGVPFPWKNRHGRVG